MMLVTLAPTPRWQRFAAGRPTASGDGWPQPDPATPLVLAVPGEDVTLHWIDLPELAPAQAAAAARLALADRLAEPDAHIAAAPGAGVRVVAAVSRGAMAQWMAQTMRAGWTATAMLPDTLLLPVPDTGWAVCGDGQRVIARSKDAAFAAEPELAAAIIGDADAITAQPWLPAVLPINLLVGDYGPITRWRPQARQVRRLAMLAAGIAVLWIAGDIAALLRARSAVRAADAGTLALVQPFVNGAQDGAGALAALKAEARRRGAGGGLAALAGPVVQAIAVRAGAGLASLNYTPGGGLIAGVAGGSGEAQALAAALQQAGLTAAAGATRAAADGSVTDVTVRGR